MALCLKFFCNKLTNARTLVLKRKHVTSPAVIQPCTFLQEFLGTENGVSPASHPVIPWCWKGQTLSSSTESRTVNYTNRKRSRLSDDHQRLKAYVHSTRNQKIICQPDRRNRKYLDSSDTRVDSLLCVGVRPYVGTTDDISLKESCCTTISHPVVCNVESNVKYSDIEKQMLLLSKEPAFTVKPEFISGDPSQPPNEDQLERIRSKLAEDLSMLFVSPFDYRIYHPEIIFENNIQGQRTEGIVPYVKKVCWLRTVGHLRYIYVKFEVMKITAHPEDGCVRVRWRIRGIRATKILKFWKFKLWDWSTLWDQLETWYEGFSTFHVLGDGLIHKHVADRMIPDKPETKEQEGKKKKKIESVPEPSAALFLPFSSFYAHAQNVSKSVIPNVICITDGKTKS